MLKLGSYLYLLIIGSIILFLLALLATQLKIR